MKKAAALLTLLPMTCVAELSPAEWQLPVWSHPHWKALRESKSVELSLRLNPFVWQGDFDGDKRLDLALLVKRTSDGKEGIAVLWRNGAIPMVLGAGTTFGNGDDFSWIDHWGVEEAGSLQESNDQRWIFLGADALLVGREAPSSGVIYFVKGRPQWEGRKD